MIGARSFILLADVRGLSMLTIGINAPPDPSATESTVLGPFFVEGAPRAAYGAYFFHGAPGGPCWFRAESPVGAHDPLRARLCTGSGR